MTVRTASAHARFARPVIEFRDVSVRFDEKPALQKVSFTLERGEILGITGASGSGKTVLLHVAAGLLVPDEGHILIQGQDLASLNERQLLSLRSESIGLVFQEDTLFTGLSVYDNTAYRLDERGWNEDDIDRAVHEILRFVGLEDHLEKLPEELSIGMKRRLELARALVGWPQIMLFDEPTSGLGPINSRQVLNLIIRARDLHEITALYVTKELHEFDYLVTHTAYIDSGGRTAVESHEPADISILLLDEGRIAFHGDLRAFSSSRDAAVLLMTHPELLRREPEKWQGLQRSGE
jgi:phospholipid/cholesterol/gamma-HCH transport system ATP-binding protein